MKGQLGFHVVKRHEDMYCVRCGQRILPGNRGLVSRVLSPTETRSQHTDEQLAACDKLFREQKDTTDAVLKRFGLAPLHWTDCLSIWYK